MGKATGFMEYDRVAAKDVAPEERLKNWDEFHVNLPEDIQKEQGARCMDCGIPFCHTPSPAQTISPSVSVTL